MVDTQLDLDAGFIRARRNLILISLALLASLHYGLTLEKINILGNETALPKPQTVAGILWWFWAYLLWRYWTAFMDISDRGIAVTISTAGWRVMEKHLRRWWTKSELPKRPLTEFQHATPKDQGTGPWWLRGREFIVAYNELTADGKVQRHGTAEWKAPLYVILWSLVVAAFALIFRTSKFSEFVVPFVIAAAPVAYWAFK